MISGIYFLFKNGNLVYIGQSEDIEKRVNTHKREKDFDGYRFICCDDNRRLYYEKRLINYFKPILNKPVGGAREGAGRHKKEPTFTIRVPKAILPQIYDLIEKHKKNTAKCLDVS